MHSFAQAGADHWQELFNAAIGFRTQVNRSLIFSLAKSVNTENYAESPMQPQFERRSINPAASLTLAECFSPDLRSGGKKCRGDIPRSGLSPAKGGLAILAAVWGVFPIP
jgi:hypothetical protein